MDRPNKIEKALSFQVMTGSSNCAEAFQTSDGQVKEQDPEPSAGLTIRGNPAAGRS